MNDRSEVTTARTTARRRTWMYRVPAENAVFAVIGCVACAALAWSLREHGSSAGPFVASVFFTVLGLLTLVHRLFVGRRKIQVDGDGISVITRNGVSRCVSYEEFTGFELQRRDGHLHSGDVLKIHSSAGTVVIKEWMLVGRWSSFLCALELHSPDLALLLRQREDAKCAAFIQDYREWIDQESRAG